MTDKKTRDELIAMLPTSGWHSGNADAAAKSRTLEAALREHHDNHRQGTADGTIKNLENTVELDLIRIQELWTHLGLPI